jgi:hypothetical protein
VESANRRPVSAPGVADGSVGVCWIWNDGAVREDATQYVTAAWAWYGPFTLPVQGACCKAGCRMVADSRVWSWQS